MILRPGSWSRLLRLLALASLVLLAGPAAAAGCPDHALAGPDRPVAAAPAHDHHVAHGSVGCACAAAAVLPAQAPVWRVPAAAGSAPPTTGPALRAGRCIAPETPPPIA